MEIRDVKKEDIAGIMEIYRYYVEETDITFEYVMPTEEEFTGRVEKILEKYPYLVAQEDGKIVGYAYAGTFKGRAAYDWAVETSIYVKQGHAGQGYGRLLHDRLETLLKAQNILSMYACIAYTDWEDAHLTNNSMHFHAHMGYELTAKFPKCGYKFGKWYDMIWMHKEIGSHNVPPSPLIPITALDVNLP